MGLIMKIRDIDRGDIPACAVVFMKVFNAEPWGDYWDLETAGRRLADITMTPGFHGILAEEDGRVVGFVMGCAEQWYSGMHFHIREMCVAAASQRRGVGTALLEALFVHLVEMDTEAVSLLTRRDSPAAEFYLRRGFRIGENMVWMGQRI